MASRRLAETIFGGTRSANKIEKHWDVMIGINKVQVKTHAKSSSNPYQRTSIKCNDQTAYDEVVFIILSEDYHINAIYRISKEKLAPLIGKDDKV